jgi:two-component system response regulator ResD
MTAEQHRRVLVVDDDPEVRSLLVTTLRQRSLIVDEAANGREAINLLQEHSHAVVLLDLLMPVADGFTVLDAIDAEQFFKPIVLVLTGAERSRIDALDARRIHGILRKPFDPNEVGDLVAACVDIRGRGVFETMALATMISGAPILALLSGRW